jgi:electron transport complex protein RnfA
MNNFITLFVFSFFSFNLVLEFGLGAREIFENQKPAISSLLFQWAIMCITVFTSWLFFTYILSPLSLGFLEYFMLFPITVFLIFCFEKLFSLLLSGRISQNGMFSIYSSYSGLVLTALILTLRFADTASDALVLSFCFSFGVFFAITLLRMIKLRGKNEKIPLILTEQPLLLLSMALLSLVFSSIAYISLLNPLSF